MNMITVEDLMINWISLIADFPILCLDYVQKGGGVCEDLIFPTHNSD